MAQTDKKIVRKIKAGSQEAFTELYQKYSDLLFAYVLRRLDNDRDVATDIWQEIWLVAIEKFSVFKSDCTVFTWLCAIANNKISDYFRLKEKHRKFDTEMKLTMEIDNDEVNVVNEDVQETVIKVLADLSDEHRHLLMARYFENKSVDEISLQLGKSYKATESLLTRSRNAFRKKFKQNQ